MAIDSGGIFMYEWSPRIRWLDTSKSSIDVVRLNRSAR